MIKILFVCHGNICRSPMAEFVMKDLVAKAGLEHLISISSCAATYEEIGNDTYPPVRRLLNEKGIPFTKREARIFTPADYEESTYIIGMDDENRRDLYRLTKGDPQKKVSLLLEWTGDQSEVTSLQICGIYKVDSDFEIYDSNEEGTSVYIHSPYNSIYVDYDYIVELLGLEYTASTGSEVYIDKIEHIDAVKKQLKKMYGDNVEIYDNTSNYLDSECKVVGLMGKTSKIICWMIIIMGEIILLIVFSFYTIQYQKDTGLFMVLGRSRKWCIGRFAFIGMIYAISGLLLGALLYCVLGDLICSIISGIGKNVIINSTDRAIGGYDIPGIFQGFEVRIEMSAFFTLKNIIILLIISLVNWIAFMVLPVVTTVEENAKKLLNSKG